MSEDEKTATTEYESYYTSPQPKLTYWGDFYGAALDMETQATRTHFSLSDIDFYEPFLPLPPDTKLESIGRSIDSQSAIIAIRYPSNARHRAGEFGFNWAIFPNAISGSDSLKILGPNDSVLEEWPSL